jgi:hypothetical protein
MHLATFLIIIFSHTSLAILHFPYPKETFKLPRHPLNWICTVHITVASFANHTTTDITERFLTSNREKIIPTLSTMHNRSISITPVNSFFEPCTISILVDETIDGSSYILKGNAIAIYIDANKYVYRGWRHSIIIVIYFSCYNQYSHRSLYLPHRLFYHLLECGHQNTFPNCLFVPNPRPGLMAIKDQTHNIYDRKLPPDMTRFLPRPIYSWAWDHHNSNKELEDCLGTRSNGMPLNICTSEKVAGYHFQRFLNFTTVKYTLYNFKNFGSVLTGVHGTSPHESIFMQAIDSSSDRIMYCSQNLDSPRLRPINLLSPFSFKTWVVLVFILLLCATASSFEIFDFSSATDRWTLEAFMKSIVNCSLVLVVSLLEKDLGKKNSAKIFIGLIVICLGNNYKNYLTIELVYPRVQNTIQNVTELLDLNFNIICWADHGLADNLILLKFLNLYWEIDEVKREKYVSEVDRWLKVTSSSWKAFLSRVLNLKEKNAVMLTTRYQDQEHDLKLVRIFNYPTSCHFVTQPFAPKFTEFYFGNPKYEEFKWLTAKFLDHGLFEFWKGVESHLSTVGERRMAKYMNRTSTEGPDLANFIGKVHLYVFYIVVSILKVICIVVFLAEWAKKSARKLSLSALETVKQCCMYLWWTVVRCLFLVGRLISRLQLNP